MRNRFFRGQLMGLALAPIVAASMGPVISANAADRELGEGVSYYDGDTATTNNGAITYYGDDNWHGDFDTWTDNRDFRISVGSNGFNYIVGPGSRGEYNQYVVPVYVGNRTYTTSYYVLSDRHEEAAIGIQVAGGDGTTENPYRFRVLFEGEENVSAPEITVSTSSSERTAEEIADELYWKQHPHGEHTYMPKVIQDPVFEKDGVMVNECIYCHHIERDSEVPLSAYGAFNKHVVEAIQLVKDTGANSTADVSTNYMSVTRGVLEELATAPEVTLNLNYTYQNEKHDISIKGNDPMLVNLLANTNDEYYGLPWLNTMFSENVQ